MVRVEEKVSDYLIRVHRQNYALQIIDKLNLSIEQIETILTDLDKE